MGEDKMSKKTELKVAVIQRELSVDVAKNKQKIKDAIKEASKNGAKLIVLQELHNTEYFCHKEDVRFFDLAESIPGPSTVEFGELAKELGVVVVLSLFEKRAAGIYHNSAVVLEKDGSIAGIYRKMHIPDDPGFYEKFYFTQGDIGFKAIDTSVGRLGVLVCWDQWYPEAARLMALDGAEILIYPTAIGWDMNDTSEERRRQLEAWITIQRAHAVANGIPVLVANRAGLDGGVEDSSTFWGNSFICGEQGEFLAQADNQNESIIYASLDLARSDKVRRIWPFFRDRRIDAYGDILKRYGK
ncbi:MAG: N-carbamoylputrescine amidase [Campylobacterota bacterium]|nr:N-carbamoylputrescine amidase [Campylobacterota bacterium]